MDLTENCEDLAFRQEVRRFVRERLPAALREKAFRLRKPDKEELVAWHRLLQAQGWGAPAWPTQFGGTGWSVERQKIFDEEAMLAGAPRYVPQVNMIGPVLQRFGTPAQQQRFLARLVRLEDWWCQGYSEPEAGSDLASLRTSARRAGDKYFVTGQKIWTSTAPWADWMFALVRTSAEGRPNQGISFLLIDMRSPGVQTQWITGIDGSGTLAQVFLDEVEVPVENLVHRENEGWTVAKYLLGFERTGQASIGHCKFLLHLLERLAARERVGGGTAAADPAFGQRIADARIELMAHEWTLLRVLGSEPQQPYVFSMLKNRGAEIQQLLIALMLECAGPGAPAPAPVPSHGDPLPDADDIAAAYLDLRKLSIFAGTTEVQKNIIAKALLS
jgi:alkylation response protein AidB-like acyl-CoA dehydrogenase